VPRAPFSAIRPLAHANIAPPILYGQALAWATTGAFSLRALAVAQIFGLLDHAFIVLANDYADRDADAGNRTFNALSGGSRAIPEGHLAPRTVLFGAIASAIALLSLGVASAGARPLLPWLAGIAVALLLAYSYPPLRLSYRGGGELLQGIGVGVVLPLVGFHAQQPDVARIPWLALLPTLVLGAAGNILTALPDEPADRAAHKRTWVVRRGIEQSRRELVLLVGLGIVLGGVAIPALSPIARTFAIALPLTLLSIAIPLAPRARPEARGPLLAFMIAIGAASTGAIVLWTVALWTVALWTILLAA
jgi:1,4-dihydroxy-2-naphthoate octaprenyltransferase